MKINNSVIRFLACFLIFILIFEYIPFHNIANSSAEPFITNAKEYTIKFTESGLPENTPWTVEVITNHSMSVNYTSNLSTMEFNETNGSYNYVLITGGSYICSDPTGYLNVSGSPLSLNANFERTALSEYYQPFIIMNISQERTFKLNPQTDPTALSFGVMNTTIIVTVYNSTGLVYENNITGNPTNFNSITLKGGYGYVNFQSGSFITLYAKNVGPNPGYFAFDLWNYYISNFSASLIMLPPHFQGLFGNGTLKSENSLINVANNTGMSFTMVAPYYREPLPLSIWIGEGYYNPINGSYWWAQVGFNNEPNGIYDVSYAGWGVFSNYASTPGGTDINYPLIPNQTYTFTMESLSNGSWIFLVNGNTIPENGHSAYFKAPTNYAYWNAYMGVEVLGVPAEPLNSKSFFQGSIIIPNTESFKINGKWEKASNISYFYSVMDWENGQGGSTAGMNIWGVDGNIQNKSIPSGELIINDGPDNPFDIPSGNVPDVYPISGNFTIQWQNESRYGNFINVIEEQNGTICISPLKENTEVSVVKFRNNSNYIFSDHSMIISGPTYIENPAIDYRAAIFAVPLNASTTLPGYDGIYQKIALKPVFSNYSQQSNFFSLGNVNASYSGNIYIPVYANNLTSLMNLEQVYSFDPNLLEFNGILNVTSSQNVLFTNTTLTPGIIRIDGSGTFNILSRQNILFYLIFKPLVKEQFITKINLDNSKINGFPSPGIAVAKIEVVQGWTSIGPSNINIMNSNQTYGGAITGIGYSPYYMNILYAISGQNYPFSGPNGYPGDTSFGGVLKSINGGKSWVVENFGLGTNPATAIFVDPADPNVAVIITEGLMGSITDQLSGGGIFKTVNGGMNWQETYPSGGYCLQYENGTLFAATFHSILVSDDLGTTWSVIANFSSYVTSFLVLDNGREIYVGLWTKNAITSNVTAQIMESTNYGETFFNIANFTQAEFDGKEPSISQIVADPTNQDRMWAIVDSPYPAREQGNPSLFNSMDGGRTWNEVNTTEEGMGPLGNPPDYIVYDSLNSNIIYVVGNGYIYRSTDGGNYFSRLTIPPFVSFTGELNIDPLNDSILFMCSDMGLFESMDQGRTWNSLSNESTNLLFSVGVDGKNIFATSEGLSPLYSNDSGKTWTTTTKGYLGITAVDPYNSSIVIIWTETHTTAGGPFFFVSNNGGNSFFLPEINFMGEVNLNAENIAFSQNEIFVPGGDGIFASKNSGVNWQLLNNSPRYAYTVVDSPSEQNVLYASNSSGLFESTDYGSSWNMINYLYFNSLAPDPFNSSIIEGTTYGYKVMVSFDGGKTFSPTGIASEEYPLSSSSVYFYTYKGVPILLLTSDQGLFVSYNLGASWENYSFNLPSTVINSFFGAQNGTAYIATYGSGIFVDADLFNNSFFENSPIFTGYIPPDGSLTVNGIQINTSGYFSLKINSGNNSIVWEGYKFSLYALDGQIYFFNFSNMQIFLSISETGLPNNAEWNIIAGNENYELVCNETITLPPVTGSLYVLPVRSDYSIYYPSVSFYKLNSSLAQYITVKFNQIVLSKYTNISSSFQFMFWTTQIAYNKGYIMYAGGGHIGLLNVSNDLVTQLSVPNYNGLANTVVPFDDGFLLGGISSPNTPGIYYYNISNGEFTNYSALLPSSWNSLSSYVRSIFVFNSSAFGFLGGGINRAFLGEIINNKFINLTQYLPSSFFPNYNYLYYYFGAYISSADGIVMSDGSDIGIFYLHNRTYQDLSDLMPSGFNIGYNGNGWGQGYIESNSTSAFILGSSNNKPFVVIYQPTKGIKDISNLFPSNEFMDTVGWYNGELVLSGYTYGEKSSPIFIYNTSQQVPTEINTSFYGNTSTIDSAIMVKNSVYFTTFNVIPVPNETYVILRSYYGKINIVPTGGVDISMNVPANVSINNETYHGKNMNIPEFTGKYTINVSSTYYENYSEKVSILPFSVIHLNIYLKKEYNVTFVESGLPSETLWSVTFNGTTGSSTSSMITLLVSNGTYSYSVSTADKAYAPIYNGSFIVNGAPIRITINFIEVSYNVVFVETGLPLNTTWYVNLSNGQIFSSTSSSLAFQEPNYTYYYTIATNNKNYAPMPYSGAFTINGSGISINITFRVVTYTVTFTESGLPAGTLWYLNLSNGHTYSSNTNMITFTEPNGTYSYTIATGNKEYRPITYSGSFIINGSGISRSITFKLVTYRITFTESGLSSGISWTVTFNGITELSNSSVIIFSVSNGTYIFSIGLIRNYTASPSSGIIKVYGADINQVITFTPISIRIQKYNVTFLENGLPSGTTWSVTLNGKTESSNSSTITFSVPNGTYSYMVSTVKGYNSSQSSGTLIVSGLGITKKITFSSTITVPTSSAISVMELYGIIAAIIVIVALLAGLFLMRWKKIK